MSDEKLQFVCKYLGAFDQGLFANGSEFHDNGIGLSAQECFKIISKYSHISENQLSWTLIGNFIEFTYEQLSAIDRYDFLSTLVCLSQTVEEYRDFRTLRHMLINLVWILFNEMNNRSDLGNNEGFCNKKY